MDKDKVVFTAYEDHQGLDPAEPERNLMRAILRSAMEDIQKGGEPYRDARRYFMNDDDHYLFAFQSVCNELQLCAKTIRAVLGLPRNARKISDNEQLAA